ncbi:lasso RiPP family leader peptide-containing protein [Amycolatopsis anabasis]|nr:lasso RiPP family leader peptide-containing protein [Amycolatopsis anabasis]
MAETQEKLVYETPQLTEVGGYSELTANLGGFPLPDHIFNWF